MKITLLTHSKEVHKKSNTGRLVLELLGKAAEQIIWNRQEASQKLLDEIAIGKTALVYPGTSDEDSYDLGNINHFILIDSTWHEARKIHQRSPYLQQVRRISLKPTGKSRYNLRKNQRESGLCTAECVIEILRSTGNTDIAVQLEEQFLNYMRPATAVRPKTVNSLSL